MKWTLWGVGILLVLLLLPHVQAQGCQILIDRSSFAPDFDCDGVPDDADNCPDLPNTAQLDLNRNNVGDMCDLLIAEIIVTPDNHVRQGDFAHITVRLQNNYGTLQGVTINVRNRDLQIDVEKNIPFVPAGETATADFWLKIPKCARAQSYPVTVSASYDSNGDTSTEVETETITVERGNACGTPNGSLDYTIINVFDRIDIDRGESKLIPITITNFGDDQATYELSVQELGNWGTWRIDPAPRMRLSAGQRQTAYLYMQVNQNAQPGEKQLLLTATSGNQKTTIPISTYVRAPSSAVAPPPTGFIIQLLFLLLLLVLIIATVIIALRSGKRDGPGNGTGGPTQTKVVEKTEKTTIRKTVSVENAEDQKLETYY